MTSSHPGQPEPDPDRRFNRVERRRERIRKQVQQARHGRHLVPTWLLATVLGLLLAGWLYLIITS
ncbi:hypothetical protein [Actinoplanes aureus]|jgi:hypothetical protein|uniref:Uncharacterized protein n=1 Tax=Actinoplanes aureus TaxID=2792083 RepID=A0A931G3Y4_9ACTN|nr:hypothetical protein [Actinoplanes aureus]MBG0567421.1 hypothetical protein [Actinoplanes aureus]